jgi:hypothetical protein
MALALAAGTGVALIVGASALGDTVCGTTGDVSDRAQWGVNVGGNATRLVVTNTAPATAANAPAAHSHHVHVDVVSEQRFAKDTGELKLRSAGDALR